MKKLIFEWFLIALTIVVIFLGYLFLIQVLDIWLETHYFCYEYYDDIFYLHHPVCNWLNIIPYAFFSTIGSFMLYFYLTQKSS